MNIVTTYTNFGCTLCHISACLKELLKIKLHTLLLFNYDHVGNEPYFTKLTRMAKFMY